MKTGTPSSTHPASFVRRGFNALRRNKEQVSEPETASPNSSGQRTSTRREHLRELAGIGAAATGVNLLSSRETKADDLVARIDPNRPKIPSREKLEVFRDEAKDLIAEYQDKGRLDEATAEYLLEYVNNSKYFDSRLTPADVDNLIDQEEALRIFEKDGNRFDELDKGLIAYLRAPKGIHDRTPANRSILATFINDVRRFKDVSDRQDFANDVPDSEIIDLVSQGGSIYTNSLIIGGALDLSIPPRKILESLPNLERHKGNPAERRKQEDSPKVALEQIKKIIPNPSRAEILKFFGHLKFLRAAR